MMGVDLFAWADTRRAAHEAIADKAPWLRRKCLEALRTAENGLTADQVAERIGETPFAVRPRMTELLQDEKIEDTGERRRNKSLRTAKVWRAR